MPCVSRQCGLRTMRPSDQSEFASTGDGIGAIVHPSFLYARSARSYGRRLRLITEGPGWT